MRFRCNYCTSLAIRMYTCFPWSMFANYLSKLSCYCPACAQEEMKRGYFDDFKDLKETEGRMFQASEDLSSAGTSPHLPAMAVCCN